MHNVAVLNARLDPVLNSPSRQWDLAQSFYGSDQALLSDLAAAHATAPDALMFSPQPLIVLMRVLIDDAVDEPQRDLTADEFATLQQAVLGSHSALESSLDAKSWPEASHVLAFELQASALFHREEPLEVMARHDELLRLATDDERLLESKNRVPVEEWLAAAGLTAEQQWTIGFGLSAMTRAFADDIKPRVHSRAPRRPSLQAPPSLTLAGTARPRLRPPTVPSGLRGVRRRHPLDGMGVAAVQGYAVPADGQWRYGAARPDLVA